MISLRGELRKLWRPVGRWWWWHTHSSNRFFGLLFDLFQEDYKAGGCRFEIPRDLTTRGFRTRFFWDTYEMVERALVQRHIAPEDSVLELGACIGIVSCVTNRLLQDQSRHVVVEANPKLIAPLERNRQINRAGFQIEHGLVSRTSSGEFFIHHLIVGGSANRETATRVVVPVLTIEDIRARNELEFTCLHLDIEGGELELFRDNRDFLRSLRKVIVELHPFILAPEECTECREILAQAGLVRVEAIDNIEVWTRSFKEHE